MTRLLSQRLRNHRLFLLDGGEGGGTGTQTAEPPAPTGEPAEPTGTPAEPTPATVSMTQAEFDATIARRVAAAKSSKEREIGDYLKAEALTGEQKIAAERDAAIARADAAASEVLQSKVEVSAERAALAAKVDPARVDRFMRLVDLKLDEVAADGKPDAAAITAAVAKTLAEFPEFAGGAAPAAPAGASGTEFTNNQAKQWTRAEIAKLTPAEFDKHKDEILSQTAAGSVK